MTEIAQFNTLQQAMMAKGMLAAHGIDAMVQQNVLNDIFPGAGECGASLYVSQQQAEEAARLLAAHNDD